MTTNYSKNLYVLNLSLLLFSISFLANSYETTSNAYETTTSTTTSTESDVNTYDVNNSDVNNNANMLGEKNEDIVLIVFYFMHINPVPIFSLRVLNFWSQSISWNTKAIF